ncbi:hypothetical protein DPMN_025004 [Dreissena polymorpha]|uniref:Uncharacterized protein n=1 Tax=Dreissena polymorpha TaxID=45954 RepID=A0A9D4RC60_DREPO|nr:hypothetical protein DPMN_025004 [Dreissena polymorpha]
MKFFQRHNTYIWNGDQTLVLNPVNTTENQHNSTHEQQHNNNSKQSRYHVNTTSRAHARRLLTVKPIPTVAEKEPTWNFP